MSIAKNLFGVSWSHKLEEQERLLRKTESLSSFDDKANGVYLTVKENLSQSSTFL